jgi:DNA ligase 1
MRCNWLHESFNLGKLTYVGGMLIVYGAQNLWWRHHRLSSLLLLLALPLIALAAPEIKLASQYHSGIDPAGYLVSEKLDGVRAYWDGNQLYFRSGQPIAAPSWFTAPLPKVALDGELWIGRGQFERITSIVRRHQPSDGEWREVRYMLFDLPGAEGDFTARHAALQTIDRQLALPWLQVVPQFRVANPDELMAHLDRIVALGGEGLMLHRADAAWRSGRNGDLLKLKPWYDDEARVIGHIPGLGRHLGRLGALWVEDHHGRQFRLGTGFSDREREDPPAIGSLITYRYFGRTARGMPRHPVYLHQP